MLQSYLGFIHDFLYDLCVPPGWVYASWEARAICRLLLPCMALPGPLDIPGYNSQDIMPPSQGVSICEAAPAP
jgi:hypothetical protein